MCRNNMKTIGNHLTAIFFVYALIVTVCITGLALSSYVIEIPDIGEIGTRIFTRALSLAILLGIIARVFYDNADGE